MGQLKRLRITHKTVALTWQEESSLKAYHVEDGETGVGCKSSAMLLNLRDFDLEPVVAALESALEGARLSEGKNAAWGALELLQGETSEMAVASN